jgi:hypothetical protein
VCKGIRLTLPTVSGGVKFYNEEKTRNENEIIFSFRWTFWYRLLPERTLMLRE